MSSEMRDRFDSKATEELIEILRARDEETWRPEVFPMVESILRDRGVEPPPPDVHVPDETEPGEPVALCALTDPALIPVAKSLLEDAGIEYFIRDEGGQNLFAWGQAIAGFNPVLGPPVVFVPAPRLEEAREVLSELLRGDDRTLLPEDA